GLPCRATSFIPANDLKRFVFTASRTQSEHNFMFCVFSQFNHNLNRSTGIKCSTCTAGQPDPIHRLWLLHGAIPADKFSAVGCIGFIGFVYIEESNPVFEFGVI